MMVKPIAVGKIRNLALYPVKSCGGLDLTYARLTERGLEFNSFSDHQYMVVRAEPKNGYHDFVTQKNSRFPGDKAQWFSRMALVKPELAKDNIQLTWNGSDPIELPRYRKGSEIPVRVWEYEGTGVDAGDELAKWFSQHLDHPLRLVSVSSAVPRLKKSEYTRRYFPIHFQDAYPIHWFTIESVRELSERAGEEIPWQTFRPQIVVEGLPAQYEHRVSKGNIAMLDFENPKPCDRCPVTLVNPETGILRTNGQPIRVLSEYKKWKNREGVVKVIFGENMLPLGATEIEVGSSIRVTELRDPALHYGAVA